MDPGHARPFASKSFASPTHGADHLSRTEPLPLVGRETQDLMQSLRALCLEVTSPELNWLSSLREPCEA